jgi:hypothetical protein
MTNRLPKLSSRARTIQRRPVALKGTKRDDNSLVTITHYSGKAQLSWRGIATGRLRCSPRGRPHRRRRSCPYPALRRGNAQPGSLDSVGDLHLEPVRQVEEKGSAGRRPPLEAVAVEPVKEARTSAATLVR